MQTCLFSDTLCRFFPEGVPVTRFVRDTSERKVYMSDQKLPKNSIVASVAKATGVAEADVAKVCNELGLERVLREAARLGTGVEPVASNARIALRVGRTLVMM